MHFADSLVAAFERQGVDARHATKRDWDAAQVRGPDVVVHLRGLHAGAPAVGARNVLWIISHHDAVSLEEINAHDLCLVASDLHASRLREVVDTPVVTFHQATDAHRFRPPPLGPRRAAHGVVVVANARLPYRVGPRWLHEARVPFSLYGSKWERYPEYRHVVADYVPNDELADVYASATVVVADQWRHMARDGFVANRLFDVLASGGFCISDDGPGVADVFGEIVPTYGSPAELVELVERFVGDPVERARRSQQGMQLVRGQHTFDRRVATLLELLEIRI